MNSDILQVLRNIQPPSSSSSLHLLYITPRTTRLFVIHHAPTHCTVPWSQLFVLRDLLWANLKSHPFTLAEKSFVSKKADRAISNAMIHVSFSECSVFCSNKLTSFSHLMCLASCLLPSFSRRVWASLGPLPRCVAARSVSPPQFYGRRLNQTVECELSRDKLTINTLIMLYCGKENRIFLAVLWGSQWKQDAWSIWCLTHDACLHQISKYTYFCCQMLTDYFIWYSYYKVWCNIYIFVHSPRLYMNLNFLG